MRAVTAEPVWKAKAIQCSTGQVAEEISEFSDFGFLDAVRASHCTVGHPGSDALPCVNAERFECSSGLGSCLDLILARLESRGNHFEFYDQCSVPGAVGMPSFPRRGWALLPGAMGSGTSDLLLR